MVFGGVQRTLFAGGLVGRVSAFSAGLGQGASAKASSCSAEVDFSVETLQHVQTRGFYIGGLFGAVDGVLDVAESQAVTSVKTRLRINDFVFGGLVGKAGGATSAKLSTAVSHLKMDFHRAALVGGLAGYAASPLQIEDCKVIIDGTLGEGSTAFGLVGSAPASSSAARVVVDDFLALSGPARPAGA